MSRMGAQEFEMLLSQKRSRDARTHNNFWWRKEGCSET